MASGIAFSSFPGLTGPAVITLASTGLRCIAAGPLLNSQKRCIHFGEEPELAMQQVPARAHLHQAARTFYYHTLDQDQRPNESPVECTTRVKAFETRLDTINSFENFHVREGSVSRRRNAKKREQKEVDVQLAVDMLTHSFSKNIQRAILLSGDLDFLPLIDAVANLGVMVEVWYEKTSAAKELYRRADQAYKIRPDEAIQWTDPQVVKDQSLVMPDRRGNVNIEFRASPVHGKIGSIRICAFQQHGRWNLKIFDGDLTYSHPDKDTLTRYVEYELGPIEWQ
jgi:uncharacterized LabA/DUF88 family protein